MQKYTSVTGVHLALREHARANAKCTRCEQRATVYPWPLPGLGDYCAMCIVVLSGGVPQGA